MNVGAISRGISLCFPIVDVEGTGGKLVIRDVAFEVGSG
jgi:hypothetical protein